MAQEKIYKDCGYKGTPVKITKGSILVELALWCCFLVPGVLYSLWRVDTRYDSCPLCGGATMIPLDSPQGRKLEKESE